MSKKLKLNSGVETYEIDNGTQSGAVLKVNFADTNLYFRFLEMQKALDELDKEFELKTSEFRGKVDEKGFPMVDKDNNPTEKGREMIEVMHEIDVKIKDKLAEVFGSDNDFDSIFAGVNVMSLDQKGNSIISNFLEMITPIVKQSLEAVKQSDDSKVSALVGNREQRRARNTK